MLVISFKDFVKVNFHRDEEYIVEMMNRAENEDDEDGEMARDIVAFWREEYRDAIQYGDN